MAEMTEDERRKLRGELFKAANSDQEMDALIERVARFAYDSGVESHELYTLDREHPLWLEGARKALAGGQA